MTTPNEFIYNQFDFLGDYVGAKKNEAGHINNTYVLTYKNSDGSIHKYSLQRINTSIFTKPIELMENIDKVTNYLKTKIIANGGNPDRETLTVIKTKSGNLCYKDCDGDVWRAYIYIEDVIAHEFIEHPQQFYNAGQAFGHFQNMLSDFPINQLHETILQFHDTNNRFKNFVASVESNASKRADTVRKEIDFVLSRQNICGVITDCIAKGTIPLRVTHNDTKLNNILMDKDTDKAVCLIDLDTVMPGSALYDFGDSIRFGASSASEDEKDLSKVYMQMNLFQAFTEGYLGEVKNVLTEDEIKNLAMSAIIMTLECGMRFLADHIDGDIYFQIHRPNHNLDRARTQFKLVADMEKKLSEMNAVVAEVAAVKR